MNRNIECRTFSLLDLKLEQRADGLLPRIRGHAAVFDTDSEDFGYEGVRVIERVAHGTFSKTIQEADIRALVNHDPNLVLGRNKAKTLALAEDERGLAVDIDPPSTQYARDLTISLERGDVSQMSFQFRTIRDRWEKAKDTTTGVITYTRTLLEAALRDVSVVTFPAYPDTDASVRGLLSAEGVPEDLRKLVEPLLAEHSAYSHSFPGAPVQADHSAAERERRLRLIKLSM